MTAAFFVIGAALVVLGVALLVWQAGLIVAGLLTLVAAWETSR